MFDFSKTVVNVPPAREDVYLVEIVSAEQYETRNGNDRIRFTCLVETGAATGDSQAGCTIRDGFNLLTYQDANGHPDHNKNARLQALWMKFYVSLGFDQAELRARGAKFKYEHITVEGKFESIIGKKGYVRYVPAADKDSYSDSTWLTPRQAEVYTEARATVEEATSTAAEGVDPLAGLLNG